MSRKIDAVAEAEIFEQQLQMTWEHGIPIWRAEFHSAVNNGDDVPENYFSSKSTVKSRNVEMRWIKGDGLWCLHKGQYFIVPAATVKFAKVQ